MTVECDCHALNVEMLLSCRGTDNVSIGYAVQLLDPFCVVHIIMELIMLHAALLPWPQYPT